MSLRLWMTGICAGLLALMSLAAQAQTVRYIHTDALGSPVAVTNASRTVIEIREYEPYGQILNRPVKAGPGYTGHVMDVSTGLAYMQQRYYDPGLGRFLSVDPVAADTTTAWNFNRYNYANNNPYKFTDPDGRQSVPFQMPSGLPRDPQDLLNAPPRQAGMPRGEMANRLDDVSIAVGVAAIVVGSEAELPGLALAGVSEVAAVAAFAVEPTKERFVGMLGGGIIKAGQKLADGVESAERTMKAADAIDKAGDVDQALERNMDSPANDSSQVPPERRAEEMEHL